MARWRLCSCAVLNTMYSPSNCSFFNRKKRLRKIVWDIDTQIHFGCTNLSDNSIMFAIFKYWLSFYVAREKKKKITPWKKQSCLWTEMTQFSVYTGSWKWWQSVWHRFFFFRYSIVDILRYRNQWNGQIGITSIFSIRIIFIM